MVTTADRLDELRAQAEREGWPKRYVYVTAVAPDAPVTDEQLKWLNDLRARGVFVFRTCEEANAALAGETAWRDYALAPNLSE